MNKFFQPIRATIIVKKENIVKFFHINQYPDIESATQDTEYLQYFNNILDYLLKNKLNTISDIATLCDISEVHFACVTCFADNLSIKDAAIKVQDIWNKY